MTTVVPVRLIKGSDDVLRGEALTKAIDEAVGDADRTIVLDEVDLDQTKLGAAIDAAQTLPFLTDHRVVVVRHVGRYSKNDEVAPLIAYLEDPLPSTALILVWEKTSLTSQSDDVEPFTKSPKLPPGLTKAVGACGGQVIETDVGGKGDGWLTALLADAGLALEPRAVKLVTDSLGEDRGAAIELIGRLKGAFGDGARIRADEIGDYLGPAGGVPPWDLTDAIDRGDVATSVELVQRMMAGGGRHALAVMATLQTHFLRMTRLDGANVRGEKEAAALLGMKGSTYPAKKAMSQARKLGSAKVRRAVGLVAEADLDLRGARAWPGELVMEVLVARLARLSR